MPFNDSGDRLRAEAAAAQTELAAVTAMVQEQQQMQEQDKNRGLEEKFNKLKVQCVLPKFHLLISDF